MHDERRNPFKSNEELDRLLAEVRAGKVGRHEVLDPGRSPASCLMLAILLEFERQSHDIDALAVIYPRLDRDVASTVGTEAFDYLRDGLGSSAGEFLVQDVLLEVWAALEDAARAHFFDTAVAEAFSTVISARCRPFTHRGRAALDAGQSRRAARIYKWLHRHTHLLPNDLQAYVKALALTGDPRVYWADVGALPPALVGELDLSGITNLSLQVRSALDNMVLGREDRVTQREHLAVARESLEITRQMLECNQRMIDQQERQFGHLECSTRSRHDLANNGVPGVTLDDVRGIDEVKREVALIVDFLRSPEQFTRLGARIPKGILIMGPPGTGKTLLARAIAGEANAEFHAISGSDFVEMFVGVGASRVRHLFERAKQKTPSIVFIDEIDAIGRHRSRDNGTFVHEEREQTLDQLLVEMDGFAPNQGIILIGATNRPDILDRALLRPGRFDRHIVIPRPDSRARREILEHHARRRDVPFSTDVDLGTLARLVPGWSGADLENLINEAALMAAVAGCSMVSADCLRSARDKIAMGLERRSLVLNERERRMAAYHEAGHALAAHVLPAADPVEKVSIIPRGHALGVTLQLPEEDCHHVTKAAANDSIAVALAGRAAEELVLELQSSGAKQDLEEATELARRMVCEWGMSERLGPLSFRNGGGASRGNESLDLPGHAEATAAQIDAEIRETVLVNYERVKKLLCERRSQLEAIAAALLDRETLGHDDVARIVDMGEGPPIMPHRLVPCSPGTTPSPPADPRDLSAARA